MQNSENSVLRVPVRANSGAVLDGVKEAFALKALKPPFYQATHCHACIEPNQDGPPTFVFLVHAGYKRSKVPTAWL